MFNFFKKNNRKEVVGDQDLEDTYLPKGYDDEKVKVFYEGEVLSPEYTATTLVFNEGGDIRQNFNDQGYPYHNLFPDGKGRIMYKFEDEILEEYEGEFQSGQYHGKGKLIDRHGEILEGNFVANKFIGNAL